MKMNVDVHRQLKVPCKNQITSTFIVLRKTQLKFSIVQVSVKC